MAGLAAARTEHCAVQPLLPPRCLCRCLLVTCLCSTSPQHLPLIFPLTFKVLECCPTELSSVFVLRFNVMYLKIADKYIETSNSTASVLTSLKWITLQNNFVSYGFLEAGRGGIGLPGCLLPSQQVCCTVAAQLCAQHLAHTCTPLPQSSTGTSPFKTSGRRKKSNQKM